MKGNLSIPSGTIILAKDRHSLDRLTPAVAFFTVAVSAIVFAFFCDGVVREWISEIRVGYWKKVAGRISELGDWPNLAGIAALGLAAAWWTGRRFIARMLLVMLLASVIAGLSANILKVATGRTRPNAPSHVEQGWYGPRLKYHSTVSSNKFQSFPSGHTACAAGFFLPLLAVGRRRPWHFRSVVGALAIAPVALIGSARMYLGVHHFSDVVTACFLGVACAYLMLRWRGPIRLIRWTPWKSHPARTRIFAPSGAFSRKKASVLCEAEA